MLLFSVWSRKAGTASKLDLPNEGLRQGTFPPLTHVQWRYDAMRAAPPSHFVPFTLLHYNLPPFIVIHPLIHRQIPQALVPRPSSTIPQAHSSLDLKLSINRPDGWLYHLPHFTRSRTVDLDIDVLYNKNNYNSFKPQSQEPMTCQHLYHD
jgi:hypothetical protein